MAYSNPLSDIHTKLWTMMEDTTCATYLLSAGKHFTNLVPAGKRKKMTATKWDFMDRKLTGDFPECAIVQTGLSFRDRGLGCDASSLELKYELWVATGEQPGHRLWEIQFAALAQWGNVDAQIKTLAWTTPIGKVWEADLLDSKDSFLLSQLNKTIEGWSSVWIARVQCVFDPSSLIT